MSLQLKISLVFGLLAGTTAPLSAADWWPWVSETSTKTNSSPGAGSQTSHSQMIDGKPVRHVGTPAVVSDERPSLWQQMGSGMKNAWSKTSGAVSPAPEIHKPTPLAGSAHKPAATGVKKPEIPAAGSAKPSANSSAANGK